MAQAISDAVFDAALDKLATSIKMVMCSGQPANYAGVAAVSLGDITVDSGDFSKADDTSGRKVTVAAQNGWVPGSNGTVTHIALHDGTTLLAVTTTTSQAVTTAQTWNIPAFKLNLQDPS